MSGTLSSKPEGRGPAELRLDVQRVDAEVVRLSVVPGEGSRTPSDVVCVVDVSGSMGMSADAPDTTESSGYSILDIVRHALNTIVHLLGENDRVAIVAFSSTATTVLPLTRCDAAGQAVAEAVLVRLESGGGTNMWCGLEAGLQLVEPGRASTVLLLTDGVPSDHGHCAKLEQFLAADEQRPVISTFGFGYSLNSALLEALALLGGGAFSFIPDIGLVGTTFVHACANLLTRMADSCTVTIRGPSGLEDAVEGFPVKREEVGKKEVDKTFLSNAFSALSDDVSDCSSTSDRSSESSSESSWRVEVGQLQHGQAKSFLLRLPSGQPFEAVCHARAGGRTLAATAQQGSVEDPSARIAVVSAVACARRLMDNCCEDAAREHVAQAVAHVAKLAVDDRTEALLQDLEGQITLAISRNDWYKKWGCHYLPSLQGAHTQQQCNNFKDPGVQLYGSDAFRELRDQGDETFLRLPAPTPTCRWNQTCAPGVACRPPPTMAVYYNAGGGCFARGQVPLDQRPAVEVAEVKAGDVLQGGAVVQCVVEMRMGGPVQMVELDGVLVTPWHPVRRVDGAWSFPSTLAASSAHEVEAVYTLLLEEGPTTSFAIGGWDAVALGHGLDTEPCAHPFFGSREAVVASLKPMAGWARGHVVLGPNACLRGEDGRVCGWRVDAEAQRRGG